MPRTKVEEEVVEEVAEDATPIEKPRTSAEGSPVLPQTPEMSAWERQTREANAAFVKAQSQMGNVGKDAKGNYGKFVSLPKLLESVLKALNANDLFLTQPTCFRELDNQEIVRTRIKHINGMTVAESEYPVSTADKSNPQKVGSGVTYARRYALMSLVGIGAEDDEGELAKQPAQAKRPVQTAKAQVIAKLNSMGVNSAEKFQKLAKEAGIPATTSKDLTEEQSALWLAKLSDNGGPGTPF